MGSDMFHRTERLMADESSSSRVVSSHSLQIRRGLTSQDRGSRAKMFTVTDIEDDLEFDMIGQRLAAMNLLSPLAISDEFSTVRLQHNRAFSELLHATSASLFPQVSPHFSSVLTKDGLFQAQTSRYLSEFEEIAALGKGSYGKVFKVINKLDGQEYAVKKILIKKVTRDDCMKVLREVKVLSSLQHPNIVGYHTAWMEHVQPAAKHPDSLVSQTLPALGRPSDSSTEEKENSSNGSSIVFEYSAQTEARDNQAALENSAVKPSTSEMEQAVCPKNLCLPQNFVPCVFLGKPRSAVNKCPAANWEGSTASEDELSQNRLELNNNSYIDLDSPEWADHTVQFHLMLYIQMQLCEGSLKDWIQERNARASAGLLMPGDSADCEHSLKILKKILEGVEHIHSQGIMHRDLKPRNIFLHGSVGHVKIGDFGLACQNIIMDENEPQPSSSKQGANTGSAHTSGVGTFVYAAPEQLKGSHYDSKSDMYSIGVITLELFQPFGTEMERVHTLGELRQGKIPKTLARTWPLLSKYLKLLTSSDPSLRPSASQLLESDLFSSTDVVIHNLKRRVDEQEEEILQLRRQISELQISSNELHTSESAH
ncbi:hypothetical protein DNTS_026251 [Danionella cerebrum]|uniref:Eukaryotic translation initiation factor 2-alpha kinase 1 n=1 Tax=Danionella cerebrum TaxID=2873325 RepID=A0A553QNQ5_9TELE|nr:hypothetical protein DNTS_026251 [Danionella translucida]